MQPPARVTVPTCIGCGSMWLLGSCDTGCSEHKLELVRGVAYDSICAGRREAAARAGALAAVVAELAEREPEAEAEAAYRAIQEDSRAVIHRHPDPGRPDIELEQPAEAATTWWCAECGGVDAPQPCLGICVWRHVEWVERSLYELERESALRERAREQRLRTLLRRVASTTPRPGQWERTWQALQTDARRALE